MQNFCKTIKRPALTDPRNINTLTGTGSSTRAEYKCLFTKYSDANGIFAINFDPKSPLCMIVMWKLWNNIETVHESVMSDSLVGKYASIYITQPAGANLL